MEDAGREFVGGSRRELDGAWMMLERKRRREIEINLKIASGPLARPSV